MFAGNLLLESLKNENYRKVIHTGIMQLVVMNLLPQEDIPEEVHDIDQFFFVTQGVATVKVNRKRLNIGEGESVIVPAGSKHYVRNDQTFPLKLFTIYSSPEHPEDCIQRNPQPYCQK